jgi:hypothetical protein
MWEIMPILAGSLRARVWRVVEPLPSDFNVRFDRSIRRHAFKPIEVEKGERSSTGWVSLIRPLDAALTLEKCLFGETMALGLRVDRVSVSSRLLRAAVEEEVARILRERRRERLSTDQRRTVEEKVRLKLLKSQSPRMSIYETAWRLESGLVLFAGVGGRLNLEFAELFTKTFGLRIDAQFPYVRAESWAQRKGFEADLRKALPSPFSATAPAEVIEMIETGGSP